MGFNEDEEVEHITLPAGDYFIGDPCYVIPDDIWSEIHGSTYGEVMTDGIRWVINSTHSGDGVYKGSNGYSYSVDAGTLGMVPASLCDSTDSRLGTFHKFDTEITYCVYRSENATIFSILSDSFKLEIKT